MKTMTKRFGESWYWFIHTESSISNPVFIMPALWVADGSLGLQARYFKFTIGFLKWRAEIVVGKQIKEPSGPLDWDKSGFSEFIKWAGKWNKKAIPKSSIDKWLMNTDWERFIKMGGAKYHYGRIILVRDIMDGKNLGIDSDIEVDIPKSKN